MKIQNNKGFTLIELILSIGLIMIIMLGLFQWESVRRNIEKGENAGKQMAEIGQALGTYLSANQQKLAFGYDDKTLGIVFTGIEDGCVIQNSTAAAQQGAPTTEFGDSTNLLSGNNNKNQITFVSAGGTCAKGTYVIPVTNMLAPLGFATNKTSTIFSPLGYSYIIQISNNRNKISGLVVSAGPAVKSGTNNINWSAIGAATTKMGPQGGYVPIGGINMLGLNNGWNLSPTATLPTVPFFPAIRGQGYVGYRTSPVDSGAYDDLYLRIDGTNFMTGNLNAGNYDLQNATNISYNGWLTGYGILANTINSGTITNSGDIVSSNLISTNLTRSKDLYLNSDPNVAPLSAPTTVNTYMDDPNSGAYLSDLLPKYVSQGVAVKTGFCNSAQMAPCNLGSVTVDCSKYGARAVPRVVVVPMVQTIQGRTYGEINLINKRKPGEIADHFDFGLKYMSTYSQYMVYAKRNGNNFDIYSNTPSYIAPPHPNPPFCQPDPERCGTDVKQKFSGSMFDSAVVEMFCDINPT